MRYKKEEEQEIKKHLAHYMDNVSETKDLRNCCEKCEKYMGEDHDYNECKNCNILNLWYEVKWWRWWGSWVGCHDMNY